MSNPMTSFSVVTPTIAQFGRHTLGFKISYGINWFEQNLEVNVRNRAPYFDPSITNKNFTA
jgi:hypothetical protein